MKNFKFSAVYIAISIFSGSIHATTAPKNTTQASLVAYLYSGFGLSQQSIPAADQAPKNTILLSMDGLLCKTNDLQTYYEIGAENMLHYVVQHGNPSISKFFAALAQVPAVTEYESFYDGIRVPQIIVDWLCNAQELRDIQDAMMQHIFATQDLTIIEKNFFIKVILLMTTPEKFATTRQIIPAGIELARTLKKLGYKLYIFANWDAASFSFFMQKFPDLFTYEGQQLFDGIMISGKTHIIQPEADAFAACLNKFKINKSKTIFIDSHAPSIQAAHNLGIDAIHCKNRNIAQVKKELVTTLSNKK